MNHGRGRKLYRSFQASGKRNQMSDSTKNRCKKRFKTLHSKNQQTTELSEDFLAPDDPYPDDPLPDDALPTAPASIASLPTSVDKFVYGINIHSSLYDHTSETDSDTETLESGSSDSSSIHCSDNQEEAELIYPGARLSSPQSLLLIQALMVQYGLPDVALQHLLAVVSAHLPKGVYSPRTSYDFKKQLDMDYSTIKFYFPCDKCDDIVSEGNPICSCSQIINVKAMKASGQFFVLFDIAKHMGNLMSQRHCT